MGNYHSIVDQKSIGEFDYYTINEDSVTERFGRFNSFNNQNYQSRGSQYTEVYNNDFGVFSSINVSINHH